MTKTKKCDIIGGWLQKIASLLLENSMVKKKPMMNRYHNPRECWKLVKLIGLVSLMLFIAVTGSVLFGATDPKYNDLGVNFEARLKFYLDMKTKRFLHKMALKEQLLLELIQNVTNEIRARGKAGLHQDDAGFELIYSKENLLLSEYEAEIRSIKNIIAEIEQLEQAVQQMDDLKLIEEVEQLKDRLMAVLDDQKSLKKPITHQQAAAMIQKYSSEIGRLLEIYEQVDSFQKRAVAANDVEMVKQLDQQKNRIIRILEESRIAGPSSDQVVKSYIDEAASLVDILKKIDLLEQQIAADSSLISNIEGIRNNIISSIDGRILELFGYVKEAEFQGKTISDYFNAWKAKRVADYQARYTKYRIIREKLIDSATEEQRKRMLEREVSSALLNYSNENYELAELQFQQIYSGFKDYYKDLDGILFYRSEANFANRYYDAAQAGYLSVINDYPQSQYLGQCYLRLMMIGYNYGWYSEFFKYFEKVKDLIGIDREDLNKAYYLAGYLYLKQKQFDAARTVLENIKDNSQYYLPAQYLLGIVFSNLEKYSQAREIFEKIAQQRSYPWTDLNYSIFRNEALLKLGYFHYQRGEYAKAISYFDQISKGYEKYDAGLIGQAWSNLKQAQYSDAIQKVEMLANNYLLSNYTYEAMVLSAHCKRILNRPDEALMDLQYVSQAGQALNKAQQYNEERKHLLAQLDELEILEEQILEQQNSKLYPQVSRIRDVISDALLGIRYRGAMSGRLVEEYNDKRKTLLKQVEEFNSIIHYAREQGDETMLANAIQQRNRLINVLESYQENAVPAGAAVLLNYPLATKEVGLIYRRGIITNLMRDLTFEKQRIQQDLEMISQLNATSAEQASIDAIVDLEILEDDLRDLNNQLNRFQVWLAEHDVETIKTETEKWASVSGFGISDINFSSYFEKLQQIGGYQKNLTLIDDLLKEKREQLEQRVKRFDDEVKKIERELEAEKIRLEKLEKERYFQEIYFETKTREVETEEIEYQF